MPETIGTLDVRKGPYFADEGDFASVGNRPHRPDRQRRTKAIAQMTARQLRLSALPRHGLGQARRRHAARRRRGRHLQRPVGQSRRHAQAQRRRCATARAPRQTASPSPAWPIRTNGIRPIRCRSARSARARSDCYRRGRPERRRQHQPLRAVGAHGRGPTTPAPGRPMPMSSRASSICSTTSPISCSDPVYGDQFHQHDDRLLVGRQCLAHAQRLASPACRWKPRSASRSRYDDIDLGLTNTFQRSFLSNVRSDKVGEGSVGIYAENTVHWTDWLRTIVGWRGDYLSGAASIRFSMRPIPARSSAGIGSPKFTMVFGPFNKTEFFFGAGYGMHSNDVRGVDHHGRADRSERTKLDRRRRSWCAPRAPKSASGPNSFPGLDSSVSVFVLDQAFRDSCSTAMPATPRRAGRADAMAWNGPTAIGRAPGSPSTPTSR